MDTAAFEKIPGEVWNWIVDRGPGLVAIIIIYFLATWILNGLFKRIRNRVYNSRVKDGKTEEAKRVDTLFSHLRGLIRAAVAVIFIFIFLGKLGLDIAPLLAGAGIIGLAIGFGAQELVRDVISGFFFLIENHARVGDVVEINGIGGLVESIELRTIELRDYSGVVHIFQHGKINSLSNRTREWSATVLDVGVAYKEDPKKVMEIIQEVGQSMKKDEEYSKIIRDEVEIAGLDRFGDSAIVFKVRIKTNPGMQWQTAREFNYRIKYAFDKAGIEIPFPQRTIHYANAKDAEAAN